MTDAGTPWGEPRRDALAEEATQRSLDVWKRTEAACAFLSQSENGALAITAVMEAVRGEIYAVLQHLASQRQEEEPMSDTSKRGLEDSLNSLEDTVGGVVRERTELERVLAAQSDELTALRAQAAAQGEEISILKEFNEDMRVELQHHIDEVAAKDALVARLVEALKAASHALRSYQYGNGSPDLAKTVADRIDAEIPPSRTP